MSFALICIDRDGPDGNPWTHWVAWNIPANETRLLEGIPPYEKMDNGMMQGLNGYLEFGWGGPCPPHGTHRYEITLYALDSIIEPAGKTRETIEICIGPHIMESSVLSAVYGKDRSIVSFEALREGKSAFSNL